MSNLTSLSLLAARSGLAAGEFTATELVQAYLDRIAALDPQVQSYLFVNAKAAQDLPTTGALAGLPIAHKDNFCTAGMPSTAASKILQDYVPPYDATSVARLSAQGAVTLGKLNTDEFTMGSSCETSAYRTTANPWDLSRVPGGSSGGSAAAVAADLCIAATGTDTGGSIRQPAAFCGVFGCKPTYGRISRYGVMSMASSLDTIGILTKTVADAAALLQIMSGHDSLDATTPDRLVPDYTAATRSDLRGVRIGVPREYFIAGLDPQVEQVVQSAIAKLEELGGEIVPVSLPHTEYAVPTYYLIAASEISANMARYDGLRYGPRATQATNLIDSYFEARTAGFGDEVKRRIMLGTFALSAGYADAYYKKALRVRTLIKQDFDQVFQSVDLLATPVAPTTAFRLGEKVNDPIQMYLNDIFTIPASLAGVPACSVPCGFAAGLPVGLQLISPQFTEELLLSVAGVYEQATEWHLARPTLG